MKLISILLLIVYSSYGQISVQKSATGYSFFKDGKSYYVKGVGGEVNLDYAVKIGANSIRTWGVENAQKVLDEAQQKGLTVMLGMWLQHERHGFDYDDTSKVNKQTRYFKSIVDKYKNHPALLMWGIGNELNLQYTNPNCWDAVQTIAKYIHETDPNHPTSTVTAGLDSTMLYHILNKVPDMDVFCINTYGDIEFVVNNIAKFGWKGPYMITEWGPNGYWESPKTEWGVSIEQNSFQKKETYYNRYLNFINNKPNCLGSYVFLWGAKQEYTETWFGLFSKNNIPTEPLDALEMVFLNRPPLKPAPTILSFTINSKTATDNIYLTENTNTAIVDAALGLDMKNTIPDSSNKMNYIWKILAESTDKKSGGDKEDEAEEIGGLIKKIKGHTIQFKTPSKKGAYRLFVEIKFNGKSAYANIPFYVDSKEMAKTKKFGFKYTDINDFEK